MLIHLLLELQSKVLDTMTLPGRNINYRRLQRFLVRLSQRTRLILSKKWRDRVGAAEAAKITSEAAARGTSMHLYLEKYCLGDASVPGEVLSW